jgi:hypothetical protein
MGGPGSGGARANSGPPPDPMALRRDRPQDQDTWTSLPAEGRTGRIPPWPLDPEVMLASKLEVTRDQRILLEGMIEDGTAPKGAPAKLARLDQQIAQLDATIKAVKKGELKLWKALWRTPQAVMWEKMRWTREVALYVRLQIQAEIGYIEAGKEARMWSDRLGLNPSALLRNRWRIVAIPKTSATASKGVARSSSRERFTVVTGGGEG